MDASTTAAAALAIAIASSEQSAMEALLLERERLAMVVEDQASWMAQRHWVGTLQLQRPSAPMTWREAYQQMHGEVELAHGAMRAALQALSRGDPDLAERILQPEIGSAEEESEESEPAATIRSEEEEEEEEEDMEVDVEVEP